MKQIILASTSPRRKELLHLIGLKFRAVGSNFDEKLNPRLKPRSNAEQLSLGKAQAVAADHADCIIIAADTFIVFDDEILGKPGTAKAAKHTLSKLSGRQFEVITGFTILDVEEDKCITKSVVTTVLMKKLTKREIEGYVATGEPLDAAGAFKMQEKGSAFVERIEGSYFNIVGLPIYELCEELKKFGIYVF